MKRGIDFKRADEIADLIHEKVEKLFEENFFAEIEKKINILLSEISREQSISINISFKVFDEEREREILINEIGRTYEKSKEFYNFSGGDALAKYISNGEIITIQNGVCPNCWDTWIFKDLRDKCTSCGFQLGNEIKYLIDDNCCPYCLKGEVTMNNPKCDSCGHILEEKYISWG